MGSPFGGQDLLTNQRAAPRVVFHRKDHLIGPDGRPISVKTFDISSSGIGLLSPHPIEAKRIFALNVFTLHTALPEIALQGLVATACFPEPKAIASVCSAPLFLRSSSR